MTTQTLPKDSGSSLFPLVLSIVAAAATGVLWAFANPIQLVPGVIQWRIFAFLPPLIGILLGWKSGFICGYLGTIVWSLLAGTFIPFDKSALVRIALVCLVVGFVMVAAVSASLAFLGIFPFWWAVGYLGLSDIVPMLIGTPLLVVPALKILNAAHPAGFKRF